MRKLISCKYHEDSQTVELLYTDGTLIDIDCMTVEDEVAQNMYERSELDCLLTHDPVSYADLILNGDVEAYLQNVTDFILTESANRVFLFIQICASYNLKRHSAVPTCSTMPLLLCVEK